MKVERTDSSRDPEEVSQVEVTGEEQPQTDESAAGTAEDTGGEVAPKRSGQEQPDQPERSDKLELDKLLEERRKLEEQLEEQRSKIAALETEKQELWDRMLRLQADFDNYRRRTREEAARAADLANEKVLRDLLGVLDNLERAVAAAAASSSSNADSLLAGVEMVLKQLREVLRRWEVEPIPAAGEAFDPNKHDAIMRVDAGDEYPSGTVVEELQKGYTFKGKVIRPSLVKVAQ